MPKFSAKRFVADLEKAGGLSDDDKKALERIFGIEGVEKQFTQSWIPQEEWSRRVNDMATEKKALKEQENQLKKDYESKTKQLETLQNQLASTNPLNEQKIKALEEAIRKADNDKRNIAANIMKYQDGAEVLREIGLTDPNSSYMPRFDQIPANIPVQQPQQQAINPNAPFNPDDFFNKLEEKYNPIIHTTNNFSIDYPEMRDEYFSLTGKHLDGREFRQKIVEGAAKGLSYQQVYEQEYDIATLRQQKMENDMRAKIRQELEDEYQKKASQNGLPQNNVNPNTTFYEQINSARPKEHIEQQRQQQSNQQSGSNLIMDAVMDYENQIAQRAR